MASRSLLRLGLAIVALLFLLAQVSAHVDLSADEFADYHRQVKRNSEALGDCLKFAGMQEHNARMLAYRNDTLHKLRKARGIDPHIDKSANLSKRSDEDRARWAAINHEQKPGHSQDPQDIFHFRWNEPVHQYNGIALTLQSQYGPYRQHRQPWRQDVRAGERGIYLRLAMQVIDITTCLPLQGAQVEIWHANSMGAYDNKMDGFLRGWQSTSFQGTVDFDTNFPGHYPARATHMHVTVRAPGTTRYVNAGRIYFNQRIVDEVNLTDRYKDNTAKIVHDLEDAWLSYYDATATHDPFVHWSRIGPSLEDGGLLGWISIGVNPKKMDVPQKDPNGNRNMVDWHLG